MYQYNSNDYYAQLGQRGEDSCKRILENWGYSVQDVSKGSGKGNPDMDLIAYDYVGNRKSIEVKYEAEGIARYGNFYIEYVQNAYTGAAGWLHTTKADEVWYGDDRLKKFYVFRMSDMRDYIDRNRFNLRTRRSHRPDAPSEGYIVSVWAFKERYPLKEIDIPL